MVRTRVVYCILHLDKIIDNNLLISGEDFDVNVDGGRVLLDFKRIRARGKNLEETRDN
jgi:hypothetical protein